MKIKLYISFIILFFSFKAISQETLSLDQAIEMALKNNYGIKIALNSTESFKNNLSHGNADLLPKLDLSGYLNHLSSDANAEAPNQEANYSLGYNVKVDYTIYNGGNRRQRYKLLKSQFEQAELENRIVIENTIIQVVERYLTLAITSENIKSQESSLAISKERMELLKWKNEFGQSNLVDVLNATVDFNKDSIKLLNLNYQLTEERLNLKELISEELMPDYFLIETEIEDYTLFNLDNLIQEALLRNTNMHNLKNQINQSEINLKIMRSNSRPSISFQSTYQYNKTHSPDFSNRQLQSGFSLNMPIFDGHKQKTKIKNAKLEVQRSNYSLSEERIKVKKQIYFLWEAFQNQLKNIALEEANKDIADKNLYLSKELLKTGQITNTQFREAQLNQLQANANWANAKFTAKKIEFELLRITGRLLS
jgi:outer membrane protein TolC